jgi:hypothetical protein
MQSINASDFISFYSNIGKAFQPDENQTLAVNMKIAMAQSQQKSQENFVFSLLNDLGLYYSQLSNLNPVKFKFICIHPLCNLKI